MDLDDILKKARELYPLFAGYDLQTQGKLLKQAEAALRSEHQEQAPVDTTSGTPAEE